MENYFSKVKHYLLDLEVDIINENSQTETFLIKKEESGIMNMIVAVADPILIVEQKLFEIKNDDANLFKKLLKKNRDIIHGALALDETGKVILYRDTLEIENLDLNELEATINSLALFLAEFAGEIIGNSK